MKGITWVISLTIGLVIGFMVILNAVNILLMTKSKPNSSLTTNTPQTIELKITSADSTPITVEENKDIVMQSMEVDNPNAEFSGMTKMSNNVAYMQVYGTITMAEGIYLLSDYEILKNEYNCKKIVMLLNSGGGSAMDGLAVADLVNSMRKDGVEVIGIATGIIASATVPIFASCSTRLATKSCMFMVHSAKMFKYLSQESLEDLESQKKMMSILRTHYLEHLANNSNLSINEWKEKLEETCWFNAEDALKWGLVDRIR